MFQSNGLIVTISLILILVNNSYGSPLSSSSSSIDLTNVFNKCLHTHEVVTLSSQVKLSPLLSCNRDFFNVVLNDTTIHGLNDYKLSPFKRVSKGKNQIHLISHKSSCWLLLLKVCLLWRFHGNPRLSLSLSWINSHCWLLNNQHDWIFIINYSWNLLHPIMVNISSFTWALT